MPKSITLYLSNNSGKVGHIIYHQKATNEENAMVHIAILNMIHIILNEGNKLNTYINEAVDIV